MFYLTEKVTCFPHLKIDINTSFRNCFFLPLHRTKIDNLNNFKIGWILILLLLLSNLLQAQLSEQQFNRPDAVHTPRVHWLWMNGNVNRQGINLDLEALAASRIGGGILFNLKQDIPAGSVRFNSSEWMELIVHALQQADRLGLQFSMYASEGYSTIGGSWITPENASQQVVWSEAQLKGGELLRLQLPKPRVNQGFYKEIAVLAQSEEKAASIVDLTTLMDSVGKLTWNAPKGNWTVVRIGATVSKPYGDLEVDKLSRNGIQQHYDSYLKPLFEQTKLYHAQSLVGLVIDSCDVNRLNWTQNLMAEFQKRAGYDMKPYLLALTGRQVHSALETQRFLWDLHNVQKSLMEEYYVKGLRALLLKQSLKLHMESISKKDSCQSESTPFTLKVKADRKFIERNQGRSFIDFEHLPYPTLQPFRNDCYNRTTSMFSKTRGCFEYLGRSQYVRQASLAVADAAIFLSVDATSQQSFKSDYVLDTLTREDLLLRSKVENNNLVLSDGRTYRFLYLPDVKTLSLPIVRTLKTFLEGGLWISAVKPTAWCGMLSPKEQETWQLLVEELWSRLPDGVYRYGAGRLYINAPLEKLLKETPSSLNFSYTSSSPDANIKTQYRQAGTDQLWFVNNSCSQNDTILASFRITGMQPEWWNPQTGEVHAIDIFRQHDERTLIPMTLEPFETGFVIFRKKLERQAYDGLTKDNFLLISANPDVFPDGLPADILSEPKVTDVIETSLPALLNVNGNYLFHRKGNYALVPPGYTSKKQILLTIKKELPVFDLSTKWTLRFSNGNDLSNQIVLDSLRSQHQIELSAFSGTTIWRRNFTILPKELMDSRFVLDLGRVADVAEVYLNGQSVGLYWKPPFRMEVTNLLKTGDNQLEIQITTKDYSNLAKESRLLGPVILSGWKALKE